MDSNNIALSLNQSGQCNQPASGTSKVRRQLVTNSPLTGNQYWRRRKRHGRRLKYATPDQLWDACVEYFELCKANPLYKPVVIVYRGKAKTHRVPKHRPMTRTGLYLHLKIDRRTWRNYRARDDFFPVCEWVENVIYAELFSLAAAGLINPRFVAPYLGQMARERYG